MKKAILAMALGLALNLAHSQVVQANPACSTDINEIFRVLQEEYGEKPVYIGKVNAKYDATVIVMHNPKTGSGTIVHVDEDLQVACVYATLHKGKLAPQGKSV